MELPLKQQNKNRTSFFGGRVKGVLFWLGDTTFLLGFGLFFSGELAVSFREGTYKVGPYDRYKWSYGALINGRT